MSAQEAFDGSWTFEWGSAPVGMFGRPESGWMLCGRPNATPDTGWLIAHDVFHHLPGDTGSYAEEIASFGAQTWFDMDQEGPEEFKKTLATSWFSVMGLVIENGSRGVEGLELRNKPAAKHLKHPLADFWREVYQMALAEARDELGPFAEAPLWDRLATPEMADRAISLVGKGYQNAKLRWQDPITAGSMFHQLEMMAGVGKEGDLLFIEVGEGCLSMERQRKAPAIKAAKQRRPR